MQTRTRKLTEQEKREHAELISIVRLLGVFPEGIVSYVSDTYDLWAVCSKILPKVKDKILARNGKLVIRPDSGDPVEIICGIKERYQNILASCSFSVMPRNDAPYTNEEKGVVELLWDVFGGTVNDKGYKVLDPHIGVIYGDSITLDRAEQICARLEAKGFASTNVVLGIGSYTYNYNTRDTLGMAIKSTYCEVSDNGQIEHREIFKDPITDDGLKKSAKGLMVVEIVDGEYVLKDQQTWGESIGQPSVSVEGYVDDEGKFTKTRTITNIPKIVGELKPVFSNGVLLKDHTLAEVRERTAAKKW